MEKEALICLRRKEPIPNICDTQYCVGCEETDPKMFHECVSCMGGVIFEGQIQIRLLKGGKKDADI